MIYVFSDANDVSRILLCFLVVLFSITSVLELSEAQQIFVKEIRVMPWERRPLESKESGPPRLTR